MPCVSTEMSSAKRQASAELEPPVSRFLDFVKALTVRFKQLWVSSAVPLRRGAKMMCESKDWHERSICHFCQLLDRSSLVFYRSMYCSSQGAKSLRDCRTDFINVVASCALACDAEAAAKLLPLPRSGLSQVLLERLAEIPRSSIRFPYPRALLHLKPSERNSA